jgi:hypothetical protein
MRAFILNRIIYLPVILITIILGLSSRKFTHELPFFVVDHFGDSLWAALVYFGFRTLFVQRGLFFSILIALVFSYAIEFSQLYQADWINCLRDTTFGALVLGKGFLLIDLVRYLVGILFAAILDYYLFRRFTGKLN